MIFRGYRYKLAPTDSQAALLRQFAGVCRLVYNLALEQRRDHWRNYLNTHGKRLGFPSQCRELTELRAQYDWIAAVPVVCQAQALRDLDRAFQNFFHGDADFPSPRKKGVHESFHFVPRDIGVRRLNAKWSAVRLPKIGWVKFRDTRPRIGINRTVTVSADALGWHISLGYESETEVEAISKPCVGIDRGVTTTLAISTGELLSLPGKLKDLERRHRQAQRKLARCKRGSKRRKRQLLRCGRIAARRMRIRLDWHHKITTELATRFQSIAIENLNVRGMTASGGAKHGLNRSILNQGWGIFHNLLSYKIEERGGALVKVYPAYTSQTCSCCGTIDASSRKSQAEFDCIACGFVSHADVNAAINIRDAGFGIQRGNTSLLRVEDAGCGSVEARTPQQGTEARVGFGDVKAGYGDSISKEPK